MLYTLHLSPVIDAIGIIEIIGHTSEDPILNELRKLIKSSKNYVPKSKPNWNAYYETLSKIKCVSNGILLKYHKIILLETLFEKVLKPAHSGAHPGQNSWIRRSESDFFIKNLENEVAE